MEHIMCDVCKKRMASERYKVKRKRGKLASCIVAEGMWGKTIDARMIWPVKWEKINICDDCAEKLFDLQKGEKHGDKK